MKDSPKETPQIQPNPATNPVLPILPEIKPEHETTEPVPALPEIKPLIKPE